MKSYLRSEKQHFLNKQGAIIRPRNAFMIWLQWTRAAVKTDDHQSMVCKNLGQVWKAETSRETKEEFKRLADDEKALHCELFPNYKYEPKRGGTKPVQKKRKVQKRVTKKKSASSKKKSASSNKKNSILRRALKKDLPPVSHASIPAHPQQSNLFVNESSSSGGEFVLSENGSYLPPAYDDYSSIPAHPQQSNLSVNESSSSGGEFVLSENGSYLPPAYEDYSSVPAHPQQSNLSVNESSSSSEDFVCSENVNVNYILDVKLEFVDVNECSTSTEESLNLIFNNHQILSEEFEFDNTLNNEMFWPIVILKEEEEENSEQVTTFDDQTWHDISNFLDCELSKGEDLDEIDLENDDCFA